jgi:hypothetical protein
LRNPQQNQACGELLAASQEKSPSLPGRQNLGPSTRNNNEWAMNLHNEPAAKHSQDLNQELPRIAA